MTTVVRRCTRCGMADRSQRWESLEAAADGGAWNAGWACPTCAWPEADLIEDVVGDNDRGEPLASSTTDTALGSGRR